MLLTQYFFIVKLKKSDYYPQFEVIIFYKYKYLLFRMFLSIINNLFSEYINYFQMV